MKIFENAHLLKFLDVNQHNNWEGTPLEKYCSLSTKNKGVYGEMVVEEYMITVLKSLVESPTNPGHDRIIDGYKTEIKFSLANSPRKHDIKLICPDEFTFNHLAQNKDWERFIFFGVNPSFSNPNVRWESEKELPSEIRGYYMTKKDFRKYMAQANVTTGLFSPQQGGKKGGNDDYMLAGYKKFQKLINLPFVRPS